MIFFRAQRQIQRLISYSSYVSIFFNKKNQFRDFRELIYKIHSVSTQLTPLPSLLRYKVLTVQHISYRKDLIIIL